MEYIRTATREFEAGDRLSLDVEGRSGNITVEGAETSTATVRIVAHIIEETAEAADAVLDQVLEGIRHDGSRLIVVAPQISSNGPWFLFGRGTRVDYAITVPRATTCRISSRSGKVEVAHIDAPVEIEARSG